MTYTWLFVWLTASRVRVSTTIGDLCVVWEEDCTLGGQHVLYSKLFFFLYATKQFAVKWVELGNTPIFPFLFFPFHSCTQFPVITIIIIRVRSSPCGRVALFRSRFSWFAIGFIAFRCFCCRHIVSEAFEDSIALLVLCYGEFYLLFEPRLVSVFV